MLTFNSAIIILILVVMMYLVITIPVVDSSKQVIQPMTQLNEGFTNDEAIKNIASLYNTGNMIVSNLNATTSITTPNLKVTGPVTAASVSDTTMNGTIKAYIDSKFNTLQSNGNTMFAALNKHINAIVIKSPKWDVSAFVTLITNGKYFNSSQNDGYTLRFMFVHPNGDNSTTNFDYWHGVALKFGKQFFLYEINVPEHTNVPNPSSNLSNWNWRGNY